MTRAGSLLQEDVRHTRAEWEIEQRRELNELHERKRLERHRSGVG